MEPGRVVATYIFKRTSELLIAFKWHSNQGLYPMREIIEIMDKKMDKARKQATDNAISRLEKIMEEMAGAPRDQLHKREPGERQASEIYPKKSLMEHNSTWD